MIKRAVRPALSLWAAALLSVCLAGQGSFGAVDGASDKNGAPTATAPEQTGGLIPKKLVWPGVAVIIVLAVIVTAALTGPIIKANTDEDENPDSSSPKSSE